MYQTRGSPLKNKRMPLVRYNVKITVQSQLSGFRFSIQDNKQQGFLFKKEEERLVFTLLFSGSIFYKEVDTLPFRLA